MMYRVYMIYRFFITAFTCLFKLSALCREVAESMIKCWRSNKSYYIGIQDLNFKN